MKNNKPLALLFIFHEAQRTGASIVLLRYVTWLSKNTDYKLSFVLNSPGPLEKDLSSIGKIIYRNSYKGLDRNSFLRNKLYRFTGIQLVSSQLKALQGEKFDAIVANTLVSSEILIELKQFIDAPVGWYIHELGLAEKLLNVNYHNVPALVDLWIANSHSTKNFIQKYFGIAEDKCVVNYPPVTVPRNINELSPIDKWKDKFVVGTSGTAMPRKGCDLFVLLAHTFKKKYPLSNFHFVWVGNASYMYEELRYDIDKSGLTGMVEFLGEVADPFQYYKSFDVFVSTSKEESFGLACAEAAAIGKPVVGFKETFGLENFIAGCNGILVPYMDIEAMAEALMRISLSPETLAMMGTSSKQFAEQFAEDKIYEAWLLTLEAIRVRGLMPADHLN